MQPGDEPVPVFSYLGRRSEHPRQMPCHITATNERTHEIIRAGCDRSPMFTGVIEGVGPRYCPSVEDKVHRFADKTSHQIFVEPEGLTTHEIYPNGISTSLPFDVQLELVRSIAGFEHAHITRPGYAIEYDYFDPRDLQCQPRDQVHRRPVLRRPDQRHDRLRRSRGAGHPRRHQCGAARAANARRGGRVAMRPTSACSSTISSRAARASRIACSRAAPSIVCCCAKTMPTCASRRAVASSDWSTTSAGSSSTRKRESIDGEVARLDAPSCIRTSCRGIGRRVLGATLTREAHAFDLLRRPEVSYARSTSLDCRRQPEWMTRGRCRRATGRTGRSCRSTCRRSTPATSTGSRIEIERQRRHEETASARRSRLRAGARAVDRSAAAAAGSRGPPRSARPSRVPGVTPAAISLLLVHLKRHSAGAVTACGVDRARRLDRRTRRLGSQRSVKRPHRRELCDSAHRFPQAAAATLRVASTAFSTTRAAMTWFVIFAATVFALYFWRQHRAARSAN